MEKSDKKSVILAFIFLFILIGFLGYATYVKVTYKEENNNNNNTTIDTPVMLSLDNIIKDFNSSKVASDYFALGTTLAMEKGPTGFNIVYSNEEENGTIEGTYVAYTISIKFNKDNTQIANDVFKELVNISCKNQKYADRECDLTVDEFMKGNYSVDGLIYEKMSDEEIYLKVNTAKKLELFVGGISYNAGDLIDINNTNYIVTNNEFELSNIVLNYSSSDSTLTYSASVKNLLGDSKNTKVELSLYDSNNNLLLTSSFDNSALSDKNNFDLSVNMVLDDSISYENIKYLSINFINE